MVCTCFSGVGVGTILYAFIGLNSNIINADGGSNYVFEWFTQAGQPHYGIFKNIPFIIALLIGGSQYLPGGPAKKNQINSAFTVE